MSMGTVGGWRSTRQYKRYVWTTKGMYGIQNAVKEVSKWECVITDDFNHGYMLWKYSAGGDDHQCIFLNI